MDDQGAPEYPRVLGETEELLHSRFDEGAAGAAIIYRARGARGQFQPLGDLPIHPRPDFSRSQGGHGPLEGSRVQEGTALRRDEGAEPVRRLRGESGVRERGLVEARVGRGGREIAEPGEGLRGAAVPGQDAETFRRYARCQKRDELASRGPGRGAPAQDYRADTPRNYDLGLETLPFRLDDFARAALEGGKGFDLVEGAGRANPALGASSVGVEGHYPGRSGEASGSSQRSAGRYPKTGARPSVLGPLGDPVGKGGGQEGPEGGDAYAAPGNDARGKSEPPGLGEQRGVSAFAARGQFFEARDEVAGGLATSGLATAGARGIAPGRREGPLGKKGCGKACRPGFAGLDSTERGGRETRLGPEDGHAPAEGRRQGIGREGAELLEEFLPRLPGALGGRIQPMQVEPPRRAPDRGLEDQGRKLRASELGFGSQGQSLRGRPGAQAEARSEAPRPAPPLVGAVLGFPLGDEAIQPDPRLEARQPRQSRVDHRPDAGKGQARLGHRCGEDGARRSLGRGREESALFLEGKRAVENEGLGSAAPGAERPRRARGPELGGGARDLGDSRKEDEDVALGFVDEPERGSREGRLEAASLQQAQIAGLYAERATRHFHEAGAQGVGGPGRVDRRRHREQAQIGPQLSRIGEEGQGEVGLDRALVELVEDHAADLFE